MLLLPKHNTLIMFLLPLTRLGYITDAYLPIWPRWELGYNWCIPCNLFHWFDVVGDPRSAVFYPPCIVNLPLKRHEYFKIRLRFEVETILAPRPSHYGNHPASGIAMVTFSGHGNRQPPQQWGRTISEGRYYIWSDVSKNVRTNLQTLEVLQERVVVRM